MGSLKCQKMSCKPGHYPSRKQKGACNPCPEGWYSSDGKKCTMCPFKMYSAKGSTSKSACESCYWKGYLIPISTSERNCPLNTSTAENCAKICSKEKDCKAITLMVQNVGWSEKFRIRSSGEVHRNSQQWNVLGRFPNTKPVSMSARKNKRIS